MDFRELDAARIADTTERLRKRVSERFPGSGLATVAGDLVTLAGETRGRAEALARPIMALRLLVWATVVASLVALVFVGRYIQVRFATLEMFQFFQGVEALLNIFIIGGAGLFFAITLEVRVKRRRALKALHGLRSIVHVIDMHQLTKDPNFERVDAGNATPSSPTRTMSRFELTRYLDYCSEMLSLSGKLAALYAQSLPDAVVLSAVNDIELLASGLSQKIWQKLTILGERAGS